MFFTQVEGEAAVVVVNGVYKQCEIYTRGGFLFAKTAGGYVALKADGSTSHPKVRLDTLSWEDGLFRNAVGRLCTSERKGAIALEGPKAKQLQIGMGSAE